MRIPTRSEQAKVCGPPAFKRWLVILLILSPAILEAIYIKFFGVNVVSWDQWDFVPFIEKLFSNNLSVYDLFQQHNEHRLFFPRIVMLILAYISSYNNLYEMYFSWTLALLIFAVVFLAYKSGFGTSTKMLMAFIPISFMIFDLKQFGNILWGFQLQIYLCVIGFVSSIYMLDKSNKLDANFLLAAGGGVLASYSFVNGLAAWPSGLIFILLSGKDKRMAVVWSFIGLLTTAIYFIHWTKPAGNPSTFLIIEHPIKGLLYFTSNIGSPLGLIIPVAAGIGIALIIILLIELTFLIKYGLWKENAKWLSFILFSLISSFGMTVFRAGFGIQQALTPRYITITSLAIIGIYVLALAIYNKDRQNKMHRLLVGVILFILILGLMVGYLYGLEEGPSFCVSRMEEAYYLKTYKLQADDNLARLYPIPEVVRERAPILEKYKLNVFSDGSESLLKGNNSLDANYYNIRNINNCTQSYVSKYRTILRGINKKYM